MWKRGWKRKGEGGNDGGGASRNFSKRDTDEDGGDDGIVVCELSKSRRVSLRQWQGKAVVDIREFYEKDGRQMAGKKGISLPIDQWKILLDHIDDIDEALKEGT